MIVSASGQEFRFASSRLTRPHTSFLGPPLFLSRPVAVFDQDLQFSNVGCELRIEGQSSIPYLQLGSCVVDSVFVSVVCGDHES